MEHDYYLWYGILAKKDVFLLYLKRLAVPGLVSYGVDRTPRNCGFDDFLTF